MTAPLLHSQGSAARLGIWLKIPQSEWWLHLTWDRGDGHTQFTGTTMYSVGTEYYHALGQLTSLCDTTLQGQEFYHSRITVWGACTRGVRIVEENPASKCVEPEASLCKIVSKSNVKRKKILEVCQQVTQILYYLPWLCDICQFFSRFRICCNFLLSF